MEWNSECTQLQLTSVTGTAQPRLYLYFTTEVLWASLALATVMLLCPSIVLLLAHHQMLSYCSLAKPDSHSSPASWDCCYEFNFMAKNMMAGISAWYLVSSLRSSYVYLHSQLLLRLTTLVAAFLNSSKGGPHPWYWSPIFWPWHHDTRQGAMLATLDLLL